MGESVQFGGWHMVSRDSRNRRATEDPGHLLVYFALAYSAMPPLSLYRYPRFLVTANILLLIEA
jgi:hypothetical protein